MSMTIKTLLVERGALFLKGFQSTFKLISSGSFQLFFFFFLIAVFSIPRARLLSGVRLSNSMDCKPTDLAVHGISWARILASAPPGDLPNPGIELVSCTDSQILYHRTTWEALFSLFYPITNKIVTVLNDIHLLVCLTSPPTPKPFKTDIFTFIPGLAISRDLKRQITGPRSCV